MTSGPKRILFRSLLPLAVMILSATCATAAEEVILYYFHSTARCAECLQIERLSGEALRETFPRELARGQLVWRPTNADLPENTHFVLNFALAANELVVARQRDGRTVAWEKIPEVWTLAHDPERLRQTVADKVGQALAAPLAGVRKGP